jgi:hypothetical protein
VIASARQFFEKIVLENYNECHNRASDLRLAMNFAIACLSMCDWVAAEFASALPDRVNPNARVYETHLRGRSSEFALVCDMANAWKHRKVSRADRQLARSQQVSIDQLRAGDPCGLPLSLVVVNTDEGRRVVVESAFGRVLHLWTQELNELERLADKKGRQR